MQTEEQKISRRKYLAVYNAANRDVLIQKRAQHYAENREHAIKAARNWAVANKERVANTKAANYQNNKERLKEYQRAYRAANGEKIRLMHASWRERNPDKFKACIDRYLAKNPKHKSESAKRYREKYPEKVAAAHKAWNAKNPEFLRAQTLKRIAKIKSLLHADHSIEEERKLHGKCVQFTNDTGMIHEVDHIIPISSGGWHHHLNLQILPISLNRSKQADPFWEMPGYKSWRDVPEYLWPEKLVPAYRAIIQKENPVPQN